MLQRFDWPNPYKTIQRRGLAKDCNYMCRVQKSAEVLMNCNEPGAERSSHSRWPMCHIAARGRFVQFERSKQDKLISEHTATTGLVGYDSDLVHRVEVRARIRFGDGVRVCAHAGRRG